MPFVPKDQTHVYYSYPLIYETNKTEINRDKVYKALVAEGVPGLSQNYQNIHLLPIYQKKLLMAKKGSLGQLQIERYHMKKEYARLQKI